MKKAERNLSKEQRRAIRDRASMATTKPVPLAQIHPALAFRIEVIWASMVPPDSGFSLTLWARRMSPSGPMDTVIMEARMRTRDASGIVKVWGQDRFLSLHEVLDAPDGWIRGEIRVIWGSLIRDLGARP